MNTPRFPLLSRNLRYLREQDDRGLTSTAKRIGISRTYLWELENDHDGVKQVSIQTLYKISQYYQRSDEVFAMGELLFVDIAEKEKMERERFSKDSVPF
ncbi:hypothetical protein [Caudoviricetes sp.]|nr:hypothetical protein [Caudoviricetes sp.]